MSYLIQNFFFLNKLIIQTPKFKKIIFYNNIDNVFILFQLNTFNLLFLSNTLTTLNFVNLFKFFFKINFNFFKNQFSIKKLANYMNNFEQSLT